MPSQRDKDESMMMAQKADRDDPMEGRNRFGGGPNHMYNSKGEVMPGPSPLEQWLLVHTVNGPWTIRANDLYAQMFMGDFTYQQWTEIKDSEYVDVQRGAWDENMIVTSKRGNYRSRA
jgi:hypothetical protein